jgi:hypothetical protein
MSNILKAILNIIKHSKNLDIANFNTGSNRANNMGVALEVFVKNAFANTFDENSEVIKNNKYNEIFSYLGNQNNPPDMILHNSDAIEVKKIESENSSIALNSSYPKNKLYKSDTRITEACRTCENWEEKDIIYAIGYIKQNKLKYLWLIYGDCYAADKNIYQRIADTISNGLNNISDIEFAQTNELGGVKKVDPLGITNLRIRGMWHIENPSRVFSYITNKNTDNFALRCLMRKEKFLSFSKEDRIKLEQLQDLSITDVKIKNPDNPAQLIDCKLLEWCNE